MDERQKRLFFENFDLVPRIAKTRCPENSRHYSSLVERGMLALQRAAETYDDSKKAKFTTYAGTCIHNAIIDEYRKRVSHEKFITIIKIDTIIAFEKDWTIELNKSVLTEQVLNIIFNCLNSRERKIMLYLMAEMSQGKISKILDCPRRNLSREIVKIRKKIKYCLFNEVEYDKKFKVTVLESLYRISFLDNGRIFQKLRNTRVSDYCKVNYRKGIVYVYVPKVNQNFHIVAEMFDMIK